MHEIYKNRRRNHNHRLSTISKKLNLDIKLTTYVARHTFATAGLYKSISKAEIGDMLDHTNYYTTEAYFADFENKVLGEAAEKIFG
ncbi:tyrosine-type recombinase/integrase [Aquimarina algiphila]|uniref:tyrosine-type recombinase/integrase n=1 Tax=Aquimarina algiphila TaxID=2047982 RepID=UPI002490140C|nr:tyrosine-type recombinase/integrase [Aquimarina algiphila]